MGKAANVALAAVRFRRKAKAKAPSVDADAAKPAVAAAWGAPQPAA